MEWFFGNAKIFNYVILTLYCLNAAWWGQHQPPTPLRRGFFCPSSKVIARLKVKPGGKPFEDHLKARQRHYGLPAYRRRGENAL